MKIRKAKQSDIPFLITVISEAEKSGTEVLSYERIFGLTEEELKELLQNVLEEDMEGQELCVSGFLIAEIDNQAVAAVSAWVEGIDDLPSGIIKGNLLSYFLPEEKMTFAAENLKKLDGFGVNRTLGALQLESIYTAESYRGQGITGKIIAQHVENCKASKPEVSLAQIVLMGDNEAALRAYKKQGFEIAQTSTTDNEEVLKLLPGKVKVLMQKEI